MDAFATWVRLHSRALGLLTLRRCYPAKQLNLHPAGGEKSSGPAAPHDRAEGWASSPTSLFCSSGNRQSSAEGMSCSPEVPMMPGATCAHRPPHSRGEKQKPAQEGLVVRRKYYLTCIVLGKENKGPGTEPGPLASFFFFLLSILLGNCSSEDNFFFFFLVVILLCFVFFGVFGVDNARGNFLMLFLCFGTGTARRLGHVSCGRDATGTSTSTSTGASSAKSAKQGHLDCPRAGGQEGKAEVWAER